MVYTPDRAQQIAFSDPYFDGGIAAAFQNSRTVERPEQLLGKRVGVELGSAGDKFVQEKLIPNVTKITYDTEFLGLKDLSNGRIDAFVGSVAPMRYIMRQMSGVKISEVWDHRIQAANTRLEDKDLLAEFNRQLAAMRQDGTYEALVQKWFGK
jgi:polar amino acid transport system substrate-binding protein